MKTIFVNIAGRQVHGIHEIELRPDATANDILQSVGLGCEYVLAVEHSSHWFGPNEAAYPAVANGATLLAILAYYPS